MNSRAGIPLGLTLLRGLLGPAMLAAAVYDPNPALFGLCLTLAFLSDVFDGVVARRLNVATPGLRRLDSVVDTIFYACAVIAAWRLYPGALESHAKSIGALIALELTRYVVDWVKFRRVASYHMWSSKVWGLLLFIAFFALLVFGRAGWTLWIAIYAGIVADAGARETEVQRYLRQLEQKVLPVTLHSVEARHAIAVALWRVARGDWSDESTN